MYMENADINQEKSDMNGKYNCYLSENEKFLNRIGINVMHNSIYTDFPMHTHDFNETFIIVSGSATHVQGEWEYPLSRGDVFAIKGDEVHGFREVHSLDIINLMYDPGFFSQPYLEIRAIPGFDPLFLIEPRIRMNRDYAPALRLDDAALQYVIMMSDFILEQQRRDSEALDPVLRMNFTALVSYLATQYDVQRGKASRVSTLSRALAFMESHMDQPIRLTDIADSVFLSTRQLERLFNEYCGETPMKYLQHMRLKNALTLLVHQNLGVAAASRQSGFEDVAYFTRVFRATYGITPSAARKHILKL